MKISKVSLSFILSTALISSTIFLASCSSANAFYFANFESYMSPQLTTSIKATDPNVNFRYFPTNEDLERTFVRNYDLAVSSTYLMAKQAKDGLLQKLNWRDFNIETSPNVFITSATDALKLFTLPVQTALTKVYDINGDGQFTDVDNLLQYGVPYFLQDFILGYKGAQVDAFNGTNVGWSDIMHYFSKKIGAGLPYNKIALISDFRSIYSIPRIMQTQGIEANVNPPSNVKTTIAEFQQTYQYLTSLFSINSFLLNSDSGVILNNFANPKGSDVGIMYNGDLLYAAQGGDDKFKFTANDVHYVRPKNTLIVLDMMVINNNSSQKKLAYDLIKKIALEGTSYNQNIKLSNPENDEYIFGPMQNFDYVQYTSPLEKISNYVLSPTSSYFSDLYGPDLDPKLLTLYQNIFDVVQTPSDRNMFESGLNDLEKSNMYQAFLREKGNF
ncbi:MAG: hypothetical protein RSC02_01595 [Malacoplasma sp.]